MFSGVPSRNMKYNKLKTDQMFTQLHNANYSMNFLGMNEPVNKLKIIKFLKINTYLKSTKNVLFLIFVM